MTEAYIIVDGHSRFMAAKKTGLEKVPVVAFLKLDEIRRSNPNVQGSSDEAIGHQLNKSARQVCKMREIAKKADAALLEKIQNGSISINKAYEMIKATEAKKKAELLKMIPKNKLLTQVKESIRIHLSLECFLSCQNWKEERRNHRF